MQQQNYHCAITVDTPVEEVFYNIKNVRCWWAKDMEGSARELNDVFKVIFGTTWVLFKIVEDIPNKKIVWEVTDSYLPWLTDKKEWNGTRVVFEISGEEGATRVDMTHIGLVPEVECFTTCERGWDQHIKTSLVQYLTQHEGIPV